MSKLQDGGALSDFSKIKNPETRNSYFSIKNRLRPGTPKFKNFLQAVDGLVERARGPGYLRYKDSAGDTVTYVDS